MGEVTCLRNYAKQVVRTGVYHLGVKQPSMTQGCYIAFDDYQLLGMVSLYTIIYD